MVLFGRKSRAARRRVDKPAWLVVDNDFALQPCTVVDMSDNGARLTIAQTERLPKRFNLTFSRATRTGRRCEVRWKHGRSVGVKFVA